MNIYADAIRRQVEDAPRAALPAVASALWRAYAEGQINEAEAETLAAHIEAWRLSSAAHKGGQIPNPTGTPTPGVTGAPQDRQNSPRTGTGSRPRTDASLERRRRWAASGRLPPALASRFTLAEQAALAIVAAETARRGDCRLSVPHVAALAGIAETTVRNAIREARQFGLLTVEERRLTGFRNDTNIIRIISPEWVAWLRLTRKGAPSRDALGRKGVTDREPLGRGVTNRDPIALKGAVKRHPLSVGGGCKSAKGTATQVLKQGKTRLHQAPKTRIAVPTSLSHRKSRKADAVLWKASRRPHADGRRGCCREAGGRLSSWLIRKPARLVALA